MNQSDYTSLDELLADAAWVRRLAAALVSEPADAKDCRIRWDSPELAIPAKTMWDEFALEAGVSDDERREYDRVAAEFTQNKVAQLRSLYVEVTGDKNGADTLTPEAMMNEIRLKVPEASAQEAYWKLSHERAD